MERWCLDDGLAAEDGGTDVNRDCENDRSFLPFSLGTPSEEIPR